MTKDTKVAPYLFLAPFLVLFLVFTLVPLFQSVPLATQHTFGPDASIDVGMEKFSRAFGDPRFWTALRNTLVFTAGSVLIQLPVALALALVLNRKHILGRGVFRLLFFSPQLVGLVFVAVLAMVMFQKQKGLVNSILAGGADLIRGLPVIGGWLPSKSEILGIPWLETLAMPALIITALWMYAGFNMIYFLAALQNVPKELEEAAMIDGAGPIRRFFAVTLPSIKPVAIFVVLLSVIGSIQVFELAYIMLPEGMGLQDSGLTLVTYLFKNGFEIGDLGYATAIGWLIAALLSVAAITQRILNRSEVRL
ncbi:MAG: sugar ABC transporter permease [Leptolyngbya sp. SIO3F4]|nr:sugar ABC transporter permease [Leptolyngbya sp. SIO3F4]